MSIRAAFISVVPSPYQRDLFRALAAQPEVDLSVFYLEAAAPDSPWPEEPLRPYEQIMRGGWWGVGHRRIHWNWPLPTLRHYDVVVLNTLMSMTGQWIMRTRPRQQPWIFWGERLGRGGRVHQLLSGALHQANALAAIGTRAARDYGARFPEPELFNIPYHCDLDVFQANRARPGQKPGEFTFIFCGQMIARKGVDVLLQAFAQLPETARLLLVGREAELPQMLAALPAAARQRVEYAGFQAPGALPQFFARADAFVLPSRYDGWGVVVNQALAAGLPLLCSDGVGAADDLIEPGVNGRTFPADQVEPLATAMRELVEDPAKAAAWGEASAEGAARWTPHEGARLWVHALQRITGK